MYDSEEIHMSPTAAEAEALIPRFQFQALLNQDQAGRRIVLHGTIDSRPALLLAERAAFSADPSHCAALAPSLSAVTNLGANDIYSWFLAWSSAKSSHAGGGEKPGSLPPDLKLNLIYPCTPQHVAKYSPQRVRVVIETAEVYRRHVRPFMERALQGGRVNWVYNILEGRTEVEDVMFREEGPEGFLLLPDLNWDRKTVSTLHVLALPLRRDLFSLRDLTVNHLPWLERIRAAVLSAVTSLTFPSTSHPEESAAASVRNADDGVMKDKVSGKKDAVSVEPDELKLYFHYQPTYYHLHIHVVHAALEAGATQAVGKAVAVDSVVGTLEAMQDIWERSRRKQLGDNNVGEMCDAEDPPPGMADMSLTYTLGEASALWREVFLPLREGALSDQGA